MTPQERARRHDLCGWEKGTADPTRPDAVQVRADGGLVVRADCPRCHGSTVRRIPRIIAGDKGIDEGGDETEAPVEQTDPGSSRVWVFCCECGHAHPGRPPADDRYGCGTSWYVSR
jgi:hypothetical protein